MRQVFDQILQFFVLMTVSANIFFKCFNTEMKSFLNSVLFVV